MNKFKQIVREVYHTYQLNTLTEKEINYKDVNFSIMLPNGVFLDKIGEKKVHEPSITKLIYDDLDENSVFWDLGGGRGYHVLLAALKAQEDNIHTFEPNQFRSRLISKNLKRYGVDAHLNEFGLSNKEGEKIRVGDNYESQEPDLVKIDIEGGEIEALKGMKGTIADSKPKIYVEVHPGNRPEAHEFVYQFMRDNNYEISQIKDFRNKDWELVDLNSKEDIDDSDNYFLVGEP